jgi:hypothetical protein
LNEGQHHLNDSQQPRPSFAEDFPRVPELDILVEAFAKGNYALVRERARELASQATDDSVRLAARTLVKRTEPDPLSIGLLALAGALLLALSAWWIAHGKPTATPQPKVEHAP